MKFQSSQGIALAVSSAVLCSAAQAQQGQGGPNLTIQSDSTGPTTVNIPPLPPPPPLPQGFPVPISGTATQILMVLPNTAVSAPLLAASVDFNKGIDKLMPFGGCGNINWKAYNGAVKSSAVLRAELLAEVKNQKKILTGNSTAEQRAQALLVTKAIEDTTMALERATEVLVYLNKAFDKGR